MEKIISICIPTYNGSKTIGKTLDSIIQNTGSIDDINKKLEIILTDDCSTDNTFSLIEKYADKYKYIKIFRNRKNLGMDANFRQVAMNSSGRFVWFSGQDDIFLEGSIIHILEIIKDNPKLGVIYVNYSQYSEDLGRNVCDSMFHRQTYKPDKIDFTHDLLFKNGAEYFKYFNDAPSFLPATIMRKEYWFNSNMDQFVGTHFIQYANILINIKHCQIAAVTQPYIQGLIPSKGWQKNGNIFFSVMLGYMKAQTLVFRNYNDALPKYIYFKKRKKFINHFIPLVLDAKLGGHRLSIEDQDSLQYIYGQAFYRLYFYPILCLAVIVPNKLIRMLKNFKNNVSKFNYINRYGEV
jgi:glycosyltransferase involved in cell wall biosynthesis